jgi:hypothetical protein
MKMKENKFVCCWEYLSKKKINILLTINYYYCNDSSIIIPILWLLNFHATISIISLIGFRY